MVVTHGSLHGALSGGRPAGAASAVTIGNFDGVHLGHRALVDRVMAMGRELGVDSTVLTFEPHPREYFARQSGGSAPARITRLGDKLALLASAGVSRVHVARFDAAFASIPAPRFVEDILVRGLGARWLAVGRDFRYGKGRAGDFASLEEASRRHGFGLEAVPDVKAGGERISSSAVRAALAAGDLRQAERLLGRAYSISGRVAHGAKLGKSLGCATANLPLRRPAPMSGVYIVEVEDLGPGVASLGLRPTVNPVPLPLLEVHLLDFEGDLYGRRIKVCFLEKLRNEEKYAGLEPLKAAIANDVRLAREYFERHGRL